MIAVVTRVRSASVVVEQRTIGEIGPGLLGLVGIARGDTEADLEWMARKILNLRLFPNGQKNFDLDVTQVTGHVLLVSNFTVTGRTAKGRRPSLDQAAPPEQAQPMFQKLVERVRSAGVKVQTGQFQADMLVHSINDGPVTFILNSQEGS